MSNLKQFLENMKEKKSTIMGIVGMALSLLVMVFPGRFLAIDQQEVGEVINTSWNMVEGIIGVIVSGMLIISRIFPKE